MTLTLEQCQQARLARDSRFDGRFFIAVKTTGIFCRPICPATPPKEINVEYYQNAAKAAQAGYRPCLRCRPDSAPGSWAWRGVETTFQRAVSLIEEGALQTHTLAELAERLGISDRYLRQLFNEHLGMAPKQYALFHQLMFAKQLLHSSTMSIADIGLACGFNSVRRFNDAFIKMLKLTPSDVRKGHQKRTSNEISLAFRPPLNWDHMLNFYRARLIEGVENIVDQSYERTFRLNDAVGWFQVTPTENNTLKLRFSISEVTELKNLVTQVRRMLDLDADTEAIETHLSKAGMQNILTPGLRIPGVWNAWEAGIRAILGQQISVKAAITHLNHLVNETGESHLLNDQTVQLFPSPESIAASNLDFLKMPQSRKETLKRFAEFMVTNNQGSPEDWLQLKGIGPWTIHYAQLRGLSEPDCFLVTDLIVKKALTSLPEINEQLVSPWGSYATFHCWNSQ
jgi:AraC family transcriptional regulator of adaptative response / DNA-3-methyladenine glycosylase II